MKKFISLIIVLLILFVSGCEANSKQKNGNTVKKSDQIKEDSSFSDDPASFFTYIDGCWFDISYNQYVCFYRSEEDKTNQYHTSLHNGLMNPDVSVKGYVKEFEVDENENVANVLMYFDELIKENKSYYGPYEVSVMLDYSFVDSSQILKAYYEDSGFDPGEPGLVLDLKYYGSYCQETLQAISDDHLEYISK